MLFDELQHWNSALKTCLERKREVPSEDSDPLIHNYVSAFDLKLCDDAHQTAGIIHDMLAIAWKRENLDSSHPIDIDLIWYKEGLNMTSQLDLTVPEPGTEEILRKVLRQLRIEVKPATAVSAGNFGSKKSHTPPALGASPEPMALLDDHRLNPRHLKQKVKKLLSISNSELLVPKLDSGECHW